MAVATNWGPPSIAGSVDSFVDTALGGIKDYQTGQALQNLPRTADGSIDYHAAATAMYRTNPGLAAQFLKMEEARQLGGYRKDTVDIMRQNAETAADKSSTIDLGDRVLQTGRKGEPIRMIDKETGVVTDFRSGRATAAPAQPQQPQTQAPREPPKEAIDILRSRPGTEAQFEKTFGLPPGGAKQYLEGGTAAPAAAPAPVQAAPVAPQAQQQVAQAPVIQKLPGVGYTANKKYQETRAAELGKIEPKDVLETEKAVQSGLSTLGNIKQMLALNSSAKEGPLAKQRGYIGALTGIGGKKSGEDTLVLENMITGGALEQLRATFGGSPTEGERKVLLDIQGSVSQPAAVREQIFRNAEQLAMRRTMYNRDILQRMKSGTFLFTQQREYTDDTPVQGITIYAGPRK